MPTMCPFRVRYKFDPQAQEYYLFDYDEMHNHPLKQEQPQIIPFPSRYRSIAKFPTENFELNFRKVKANS